MNNLEIKNIKESDERFQIQPRLDVHSKPDKTLKERIDD